MSLTSKSKSNDSDSNVLDYDDLWVKEDNAKECTPSVYVRNEPENEIDLLWSGVKEHHSFKSSPLFSLIVGFILGVIATVSIGTILFWGEDAKPLVFGLDASGNQTKTKSDVKVPDSNTNAANNNSPSGEFGAIQKYTIQPGDSLSTISEKFYHSSSKEKLELIEKANNLSSVHSITAGKTLIIPVENTEFKQQQP